MHPAPITRKSAFIIPCSARRPRRPLRRDVPVAPAEPPSATEASGAGQGDAAAAVLSARPAVLLAG